MVLLLAVAGCATPAAEVQVARWPRAGDALVVEVRATVDADAEAQGVVAAGWGVDPVDVGSSPREGCASAREPVVQVPGIASVDVDVPVAMRLGGAAGLRAEGPIRPEDPAWDVGDVTVIRADGTRARARSAVRFGERPDVVSVSHDDDGGATIRWAERVGEHVEVLSVNADGERILCVGTGGVVELARWAMPADGATVTVRAVRETLSVVPNEVMLRARAVIETVLDLGAERLTDRQQAPVLAAPPVWEPRRVIRYRGAWG